VTRSILTIAYYKSAVIVAVYIPLVLKLGISLAMLESNLIFNTGDEIVVSQTFLAFTFKENGSVL